MAQSDGDTWTCSNCGKEEHDAILTQSKDIEVDVTCRSVYFTFNDDSETVGMAFDHSEFEKVIEHYQESVESE